MLFHYHVNEIFNLKIMFFSSSPTINFTISHIKMNQKKFCEEKNTTKKSSIVKQVTDIQPYLYKKIRCYLLLICTPSIPLELNER